MRWKASRNILVSIRAGLSSPNSCLYGRMFLKGYRVGNKPEYQKVGNRAEDTLQLAKSVAFTVRDTIKTNIA